MLEKLLKLFIDIYEGNNNFDITIEDIESIDDKEYFFNIFVIFYFYKDIKHSINKDTERDIPSIKDIDIEMINSFDLLVDNIFMYLNINVAKLGDSIDNEEDEEAPDYKSWLDSKTLNKVLLKRVNLKNEKGVRNTIAKTSMLVSKVSSSTFFEDYLNKTSKIQDKIKTDAYSVRFKDKTLTHSTKNQDIDTEIELYKLNERMNEIKILKVIDESLITSMEQVEICGRTFENLFDRALGGKENREELINKPIREADEKAKKEDSRLTKKFKGL